MKVILVVALIHVAICGNVNIRMPYINPAGVTYVNGAVHAGLAAGPLAYTTATARPLAAPFAYNSAAPFTYSRAAPLAYSSPAVATYSHTPAVTAYSHAPAVAAYSHAPLAYQAYQPVTKYAAVPTVQHVHGVADVPVTRYEAQPAVIQKSLDVAKPAIKTRKYEIRRPAIEKQFYDIEERTIVRPAGSALVELDQPLSKTQKGNAIISPAAYAIPSVNAYAAVPAVAAVKTVAAIPAYARLQPFARFGYTPYGLAGVPTHFQLTQPQLVAQLGQQQQLQSPQQPEQQQGQQQQGQQQQGQQQQEQQQQPEQQTEQPQQPYPVYEQPQPQQPESSQQPEQPQQPQQPQSDDDSVSVDNPEFAARSAPESSSQAPEQESAAAETSPSTIAPENSEASEQTAAPQARSIGSSYFGYSSPLDLIPQARSGNSVVPSLRNLPAEVSQSNQQRLIQLLTARGGVAEIGQARSGPAVSPVGEAGQIRARVLSATPAPPSAEPTGERVNTRRVVVSRPIETLQEIEVQEPVTKLERIHVQHPTFIKTARQDFVRVPTSVPVYGKALAPVAHGAVPLAHTAVPAYSTYYG